MRKYVAEYKKSKRESMYIDTSIRDNRGGVIMYKEPLFMIDLHKRQSREYNKYKKFNLHQFVKIINRRADSRAGERVSGERVGELAGERVGGLAG